MLSADYSGTSTVAGILGKSETIPDSKSETVNG